MSRACSRVSIVYKRRSSTSRACAAVECHREYRSARIVLWSKHTRASILYTIVSRDAQPAERLRQAFSAWTALSLLAARFG